MAAVETTTDPTTQRMMDETGHQCPACPSVVRGLGATAHNLVQAIEAARLGQGDWGRVFRKAAELEESVGRWTPVVDGHFEAMDAWRRP